MQLMGWDLTHPRTHLGIAVVFGVNGLLVAAGVGLTIGLGLYNIGADAPHTRPVYMLLETLRDRSIRVRAVGIRPPADVDDPR